MKADTAHSRFLAIAVIGSFLFATGVVLVKNPHYDATAKTGGLHKVCDDIGISRNDILTATCNQVRDGAVSKATSTIDLYAELDDGCSGKFKRLTPRTDGVEVVYECSLGTFDLNDIAQWDATEGKLKLMSA